MATTKLEHLPMGLTAEQIEQARTEYERMMASTHYTTNPVDLGMDWTKIMDGTVSGTKPFNWPGHTHDVAIEHDVEHNQQIFAIRDNKSGMIFAITEIELTEITRLMHENNLTISDITAIIELFAQAKREVE